MTFPSADAYSGPGLTPGLNLGQIRQRYFVLLALRWAPTGILIPIVVLLALERGLSIGQIGIVIATQGIVTLLLELPTGGLSDALGRRPVLVASSAVGLLALGLILTAQNLTMFMVAYALQGVYRALDSGPLESWFVDSSRARDPAADIRAGLARGGAVMGVAVASGALIAGALVALGPLSSVDTLALPVVVAIVIQVASMVGALLLLDESSFHRDQGAVRASFVAVPGVIVSALTVIRRSKVLAGLVAVEVFWGFGMASFEILMPVKMGELLGNHEAAAAVLGPTTSIAWLAAAAGAAAIPWAARRFGTAVTAALLRVLHGLTVLGIGLAAGPAFAVVAFLATFVVHGASNPLHMTLLHEETESHHRTTVISVNSMVSSGMASLGMIALSAMSEAISVSTAIVAGGGVLSIGALLYFPAIAQEREQRGQDQPASNSRVRRAREQQPPQGSRR